MKVDVDVSDSRVAEAHKKSGPMLPTADPFYRPPTGFAAARPGQVFRSRQVEVALLGIIPQKITASQLLFRSCDLHGAPEAAVTTILLPEGADTASPRPLLAFQCAIDAVASNCFPSYALQRGARAWGSIPQFELFMMAAALRRGWAVIVTDHEGQEGHFGAPREPGYRVLDGIRAALSFEPLGFSESTKLALWGYSGGGMATSWAVELAPSYAPELRIEGAVLGAPVGDPGQTFIRLNGKAGAGLPSIVLSTLRHLYPGLGQLIRKHVTLGGRRRLDEIEKMSTTAAVIRNFRDDFGDYVDVPLADLLATPEAQEVFEDLRLGKNAPQCPLFMVQAVHDEIIATDVIDAQAGWYIDHGAHVTYVRDRLSEHATLMIFSAPAVLEWLTDRFEGKPLPAAGTSTVWSMLLRPSRLRGLADLCVGAAIVVCGRPLRDAETVRSATDKGSEPATVRTA